MISLQSWSKNQCNTGTFLWPIVPVVIPQPTNTFNVKSGVTSIFVPLLQLFVQLGQKLVIVALCAAAVGVVALLLCLVWLFGFVITTMVSPLHFFFVEFSICFLEVWNMEHLESDTKYTQIAS